MMEEIFRLRAERSAMDKSKIDAQRQYDLVVIGSVLTSAEPGGLSASVELRCIG